MATVARRSNRVSSQSQLSEARNGVSALKTSVVNEHYSLREYVGRRAMFLGNQFKNVRTDPFKIARSDADEVFEHKVEELSVQEVQRREVRKGIEPLLPLPTTANTQTLDEFRSYPTVEWTPDTANLFPNTVLSAHGQSFTQVNSSSSFTPAPGPAKTSPIGSTLSRHRPHSSASQQKAQRAFHAMYGLADQANTTMAFNGPQQTTQAQFPDMSSSPFQDNSFSSSFAIDLRLTAATSPATMIDNDTAMQLDYAKEVPLVDPELAAKIASALGTKEAKQATGYFTRNRANVATVAAAETVASGASVKSVEGAQGAETREPEENAEMIDDAETVADVGTEPNAEDGSNEVIATHPNDGAEPANIPANSRVPKVPEQLFFPEGVSAYSSRGMRLQVKKRGKSPSPESSEDSAEDQGSQTQPPLSKKPKLIVKGPQQPQAGTVESKAMSISKKKAPARKSTAKHIETVISGNALPHTADEAHAAAGTRLDRLIANYNADRKAHKRGAIKPNNEPDFMPEHFYTKNFAKGMEEDTVRCVCGTIIDDGRNMIACDDCGVWQHHSCMGDGVPENPDQEQYSCHVCDAWVHRELIARLRREHPL